MNVNYDRVCRLCLSSRCELLPIFPTTSSDDSEPPDLASKIKDCVSVQISENDELPSNVCRKCVDNVNNWHTFKSVCERSQNKLLSLINKESSQLEEIKIKSEPLSDDAYDDGVIIDGCYPDSETAGSSSKVQPEGPPILASLGLTPRSDKKYIDPRMDWQRVHAILDMIQEDEVIDCLQSIEECDVTHQSDHDSESEVELTDEPLLDDYVDNKNGYLCKNGKILSKTPKIITEDSMAREKEVNTLRKKSVISNRNCSQPKNAWQLLFTDDLLDLIVASTNEKIMKNSKRTSKVTTVTEIKTLIGILYYHGIMRPTHQKLCDLWHHEYGAACVRRAMTFDRFKFILQNMSFDSEESDGGVQFDAMRRMRKAFEIFALNCRTVFEVSDFAVVDEILLPVHGPCPFRCRIERREIESGLRLALLMDPVNFYVANLAAVTDPRVGRDEIAAELVRHLAGSGRTVIAGGRFASGALSARLKSEFGLHSLRALRPGDENVPPIFLSRRRRERTVLSGFSDEGTTLSSHVGRDARAVHVLTDDPRFYEPGGGRAAVAAYRGHRSCVRAADALLHYYSTEQRTNDWTLSLFFALLNVASVDAQVAWSSRRARAVRRRLFVRELALGLMACGASESAAPLPALPARPSLPPRPAPYYLDRRRCRACFRSRDKRDRRTKQRCLRCGVSICKEHTLALCADCAH